MNNHVPLSRKLLIEKFKGKQAISWGDSVYYSTISVPFEVVDADLANGSAFALLRPGETDAFFAYGKDGDVRLGPTTVKATEVETNLIKAKSTNGNAWFSLEALGITLRGYRIAYPAPTYGVAPANADVIAALSVGTNQVLDPSSLVMPPECQSPANLEQPLAQQLLRSMSLTIERDGNTFERIGSADLLPNAGGESYLRANGEPSSSNRYRLGAGMIWAADGTSGSEMAIRTRVTRTIVCPISLVRLRNDAAFSAPSNIWVDVCIRVFGVEFKEQAL